MFTKLLVVATLALILQPVIAQTDSSYGKVAVGPVIGKTAYNSSISVGKNVNKNFSTELELNYVSFDDQDDLSITTRSNTTSVLWNQYYNFDTTSKVTPYIMFGC